MGFLFLITTLLVCMVIFGYKALNLDSKPIPYKPQDLLPPPIKFRRSYAKVCINHLDQLKPGKPSVVSNKNDCTFCKKQNRIKT